MSESEWDDFTASRYDHYTDKHPMYRITSQFLVELANMKEGMTVLDLACGTGVTTLEILRRTGDSGRVIAVDSSAHMLGIAKQKIQRGNVRFVQCQAEAVDEVVEEEVDLVLCNSTFWQLHIGRTLRGVGRILKKDGKFVFNLPSQFPGSSPETRDVSLVLAMQRIAAEEHGLELAVKDSRRPGISEVNAILARNAFQIERIETLVIKRTVEDIYDFLTIPVMTERVLPGLDYAERLRILDLAYERVDKSITFIDTWLHFATSLNSHPFDSRQNRRNLRQGGLDKV